MAVQGVTFDDGYIEWFENLIKFLIGYDPELWSLYSDKSAKSPTIEIHLKLYKAGVGDFFTLPQAKSKRDLALVISCVKINEKDYTDAIATAVDRFISDKGLGKKTEFSPRDMVVDTMDIRASIAKTGSSAMFFSSADLPKNDDPRYQRMKDKKQEAEKTAATDSPPRKTGESSPKAKTPPKTPSPEPKAESKPKKKKKKAAVKEVGAGSDWTDDDTPATPTSKLAASKKQEPKAAPQPVTTPVSSAPQHTMLYSAPAPVTAQHATKPLTNVTADTQSQEPNPQDILFIENSLSLYTALKVARNTLLNVGWRFSQNTRLRHNKITALEHAMTFIAYGIDQYATKNNLGKQAAKIIAKRTDLTNKNPEDFSEFFTGTNIRTQMLKAVSEHNQNGIHVMESKSTYTLSMSYNPTPGEPVETKIDTISPPTDQKTLLAMANALRETDLFSRHERPYIDKVFKVFSMNHTKTWDFLNKAVVEIEKNNKPNAQKKLTHDS